MKGSGGVIFRPHACAPDEEERRPDRRLGGPGGDCLAKDGVKMHSASLFFLCGTVCALQTMATDSHADTCADILDKVKSAANRAISEMSAANSSSQSSVAEVSNDKRRVLLLSQSCTASAEAVGILKSYRIVVAECRGDRQSDRSDLLDELDRSISKIRVKLDKDCR